MIIIRRTISPTNRQNFDNNRALIRVLIDNMPSGARSKFVESRELMILCFGGTDALEEAKRGEGLQGGKDRVREVLMAVEKKVERGREKEGDEGGKEKERERQI